MVTGTVVVPQDFRIRTSKDALTISWRGPGHWLFLVVGLFALVPSACVFACFAVGPPEARGACFLALGGLLLAVYLLLVGLLDKTVVTVDRSRLRAKHGPIPIPFDRFFPVWGKTGLDTARIEQLYVKETQGFEVGRTYCDYGLHVRTLEAGDRVLLSRLRAEEAAYLESAIERFLLIQDRPVEGEWQGEAPCLDRTCCKD